MSESEYNCEVCGKVISEKYFREHNKKCILHCKKSTYQKDWNNIGFLDDFYNALIVYIAQSIDDAFPAIDNTNINQIKRYYNYYFDHATDESLDELFKDRTIVFTKIFFPAYNNADHFDYSKILKKLKKIHFNYCNFSASYYDLEDIKVFFQDCKFHSYYSISNSKIAKNVSDVIYQQCLFNKQVIVSQEEGESNTIDNSLFSDCCFKSKLSAENIKFEKKIFNDSERKRLPYVKNIEFINCIHNGDLILKDHKINILNLKESTFNGKVKIQFCTIKNEANFYNTKFENLADFYQTEFNDVNFERTDFNNILVFSESTFNKDVSFKYTKFLGKSIFRDTIIKGNLDLKDAIFDDEANFLNMSSDKSSKNQIKVENRETARIIKNFFENTNNVIESNKFYTLEMEKREKELDDDVKQGKNLFEWIIFKMHSISSNHSQDWMLAFFWIVYITFFYSYLAFFMCIEEKTSQTIFSFFIFILMAIYALLKISLDKGVRNVYKLIILLFLYMIYGFNTQDYQLIEFSTNMNPFSIMKNEEKLTMFTLLYKVVIAYLMYQLIISIRQNTRRK